MSTIKTHRFVKMSQNIRKCTKHAARESCWKFETGAVHDLETTMLQDKREVLSTRESDATTESPSDSNCQNENKCRTMEWECLKQDDGSLAYFSVLN